jgi:hypothetical protein
MYGIGTSCSAANPVFVSGAVVVIAALLREASV